MNSEEDFSYGILGYNSVNIGDEIQSVAAMRFMPHVDEYPKRENLKKFVPKSGKRTKLIMNAWWMWHIDLFPPNDKYIDPLLIAMYFRPRIRDAFKKGEKREYLIKHGPVGCRDMGTYNWLKGIGIPAYFSGCLTITLQRNYEIPRQDYILCVDVQEDIVEEIKKLTNRPVYSISRRILSSCSDLKRMELAKLVLRAYHDAHLVVSPRLHVIMPSLAMETPVLRLLSNNKNVVADKSRYAGYEDFFNSINIDNENYIEELKKFDFDNPPQNPKNHLTMRNDLIKRCSEFTGYDNPNSLIENEPFPFIKLLKIIEHSESDILRALYTAKLPDLIYTIYNKSKGIDKYSLPENIVHPYQDLKYNGLIISTLKFFILGILIKVTPKKCSMTLQKKLKKSLLAALLNLYK